MRNCYLDIPLIQKADERYIVEIPYKGIRKSLKRLLDLCLGMPLLVLAAPIILVAAMAIKLISPGPAFFFQTREGYKGRPFKVWKLRSMVPDAETKLQQFLATNIEAQIEWDEHMKLKHDPRVIPVIGGFLRRFSIDELPQFWNVISGEMSLVGPRPFPGYHLARFSKEFVVLRRLMPPGITGLWQVTNRSDGALNEQQELDERYIREWTLAMDIRILLRTVTVVLRGKGAY